MKTTRDFLVRVDADEPLTEEKWEEVGSQIQDALNNSVFDEGAAVVYLVPTIEQMHTIAQEAKDKRNMYFGIVMGEVDSSIMDEPFDNAKKYVQIAAVTHAGSNIPTVFSENGMETVTVNANAYRDNPDAAVLNAVREQLGWVVESVDYEEVGYVGR